MESFKVYTFLVPLLDLFACKYDWWIYTFEGRKRNENTIFHCSPMSQRALLARGFRMSFACSDKRSVQLKMNIHHWWNDTDSGKLKYSDKTCPSATSSTTYLTQTGLEPNPDPGGERPVTIRLIHCTAFESL